MTPEKKIDATWKIVPQNSGPYLGKLACYVVGLEVECPESLTPEQAADPSIVVEKQASALEGLIDFLTNARTWNGHNGATPEKHAEFRQQYPHLSPANFEIRQVTL